MKKLLFVVAIFLLLESFFGCGFGKMFRNATNVGCILPTEDEEEKGVMTMGKSIHSFNENAPPPTLNVWPAPGKKVLTRFIEFFGGITKKDETEKQIRRNDAGRVK